MDTEMNENNVSRRDAIKKAAVAGAVVAWGTPAVSAIGSGAAFAQVGPSFCPGCIDGVVDNADFGSSMENSGGIGQNGEVQSNPTGTCANDPNPLLVINWSNLGTSGTGGGALTWAAADTGSDFDQGIGNSATGGDGATVTLDWSVSFSIECVCNYNSGSGTYSTTHSCGATGSTTWTRGATNWNAGVTSGVSSTCPAGLCQ